ncbi:MAG: SRPBCC family protein [Candidatus Bathyarchaeota archaeon]|nr:SRPBCC family protein [Candidatus Bathyarchaeota archaeon]MDH5686459.1 SRPBCC family protein [Candidatus Bathyarchaeota archaeon]
MVRTEKSIEIRASPEKVWEILALDRMPEWAFEGELKSVEYTSEVRTPEDKYRVGASAHIIDKRSEHDVEITESLENEKMMYRSKPPYYTYTSTYILKPVEEGTKLTWISDVEMPWGILGKALGRLAVGTGEKKAEKSLEKLKSVLEK